MITLSGKFLSTNVVLCRKLPIHNIEIYSFGKHTFILLWYIFEKRPSVIAWSIANEPVSEVPEATDYFQKGTDSPIEKSISTGVNVIKLRNVTKFDLSFW